MVVADRSVQAIRRLVLAQLVTVEDCDAIMYAPISAPGRIALMTTSVHLSIGLFSVSPALPAIQAAAHLGRDTLISAPLVGIIAGLSYAVTSVLCGRTIKRLGYRPTLLWALVVSMIAGLSCAAWPDLHFIFFMRVIVGSAVAFVVNASLFAVGTVLPERDQARVLGVMAVFGSLAGIMAFAALAH